MAYTLEVPVKFMNSEHLPQVCLFSGRTDDVQEKSQSFDYLAPTMRVIVIVLVLLAWLAALIVYMISKTAVTIHLPQAPRAKWKWSVKRQIGALLLFVCPAVFCFAALALDARNDQFVGIMIAVGALVGIGSGGGMIYWGLSTTMSVKLIDAERVRLKWPDSMKSTYDAYRDAYESWLLESRSGDRLRRRARVAGDPAEDDWADAAGGDWDQSKR